jgi:hypothetical protein
MAQRPHRWLRLSPKPSAVLVISGRPPTTRCVARVGFGFRAGDVCPAQLVAELPALPRSVLRRLPLQYTHAAVPAYSDPSESRRSAPGLAEYAGQSCTSSSRSCDMSLSRSSRRYSRRSPTATSRPYTAI